MHDFRRRPEDLKPEQTQAPEDLFEKVPLLGVIYHLRWSATKIFDTAPDRAAAARALDEWIAETRETEMDWENGRAGFRIPRAMNFPRHSLCLQARRNDEWTRVEVQS